MTPINIPNLIGYLILEDIGFDMSYQKGSNSILFTIYGKTPDVSTIMAVNIVTGIFFDFGKIPAFYSAEDFIKSYKIYLHDETTK